MIMTIILNISIPEAQRDYIRKHDISQSAITQWAINMVMLGYAFKDEIDQGILSRHIKKYNVLVENLIKANKRLQSELVSANRKAME